MGADLLFLSLLWDFTFQDGADVYNSFICIYFGPKMLVTLGFWLSFSSANSPLLNIKSSRHHQLGFYKGGSLFRKNRTGVSVCGDFAVKSMTVNETKVFITTKLQKVNINPGH